MHTCTQLLPLLVIFSKPNYKIGRVQTFIELLISRVCVCVCVSSSNAKTGCLAAKAPLP